MEVVKTMESLMVVSHYGYALWRSYIYIIYGIQKLMRRRKNQEITVNIKLVLTLLAAKFILKMIERR